jgi:hypothetical protein
MRQQRDGDAARPAVFIEFLKQGSLFDGWLADCPLHYTSPNAPKKRDVLGTVMLSVLAGHWRYAHMTTLRCDPVNPPLLGMNKVVSEDAVRRGLDKIEESAGLTRLQQHLDYATRPLLSDQAVDTRYRHHREAALRPPGGRRGELQSAQAGTAVAQLSLLHDGQSAPGAGGRGCARQPAYLQALLAAAVGVVGWPGERAAAVADPRRCPVSATSR